MKAKIIGQNHKVITYLLNGRKRFIVDPIPITNNRRVVNNVVREVGRQWADVFNFVDSRTTGDIPIGLNKVIDDMTY